MAKIQVLVIDDEARVADAMVEVLQTAGFTAAAVTSAGEALERFSDLSPDLVLLDMMMPGIDGFEFLARLRAEPLRSAVPVLITSGLAATLSRAIDESSARTLGVVGVLPKPVPFPAMLERVQQILAGSLPAAG